jgi:non-ribosomal peptide synthetase component F
MVHNFRTLLEGIAASPDRHLLELPFISAEERRRVITEFNQTHVDDPDTPVHVLFEEQAERTPFAPAAVFETSSLTYRELNARANLLAHHLIALNTGPGKLVGLSMERSLDMIVALLAILKAGGAYVPIDPEYPPERLRFMLEN